MQEEAYRSELIPGSSAEERCAACVQVDSFDADRLGRTLIDLGTLLAQQVVDQADLPLHAERIEGGLPFMMCPVCVKAMLTAELSRALKPTRRA